MKKKWIWIVLGVLVILISFLLIVDYINCPWGAICDWPHPIENETQIVSQICSLITSTNDSEIICNDFKELEIEGVRKLVTCGYLAKTSFSSEDWAKQISNLNCGDESAIKQCKSLNELGKIPEKGVLINNGFCSLGGSWVVSE